MAARQDGPGEPTAATRRAWWAITLGAAVLVSLLDAALLERKEGLFRGGFLALDPLDTAGRRVVFAAASLLADAAVAGVLAGIGLWVARRLGLHRRAALATATILAVGPLVLTDIVRYELVRYVGDAMDLGLMFDLVGRRPSEFLAVAGPHLLLPVLALVGLVVGLGFAVRWLHRRSSRAAGSGAGLARLGWGAPALLFILGTVVVTGVRLESAALDNGLRRKPSGDWLGTLVAWASDVDRDGYGLLGRPPDPAPLDGQVYPYAVDRPGNGVDENGVGGDLPGTWPAYTEPAGSPPTFARRPDVVLVVLESFRADMVGATVNGRPVTPVLDALASRGLSLARAYSHNGYTSQSRFHLMSGSLVGLRGGTTLVDDFKANGYEVAYISGQDESFGGPRFQVGFDRADYRYDARQDPDRRYSTFSTAGSLAVPFDVVEERVHAFLAQRDATRPLFLYVNFHDTHFPYRHKAMKPLVSTVVVPRAEISPDRSADLHEMYANAAANVDAAIGRVLEAVERRNGRTPAVIVTSDHGESLYEEGFLGHGYALNDVQTRVPLVVAGLPLRLSEPFGQVELRDAVRDALVAEADAQPSKVQVEGKTVFQYLGSAIARARAVGEVSPTGVVQLDFRTTRFSLGDRAGVPEADVPGAWRARALALVRQWEALVLASAPASDSR